MQINHILLFINFVEECKPHESLVQNFAKDFGYGYGFR